MAHAALFAGYHLWTPWLIPTRFLAILPLTLIALRPRDIRIGIATHVILNSVDVEILTRYVQWRWPASALGPVHIGRMTSLLSRVTRRTATVPPAAELARTNWRAVTKELLPRVSVSGPHGPHGRDDKGQQPVPAVTSTAQRHALGSSRPFPR